MRIKMTLLLSIFAVTASLGQGKPDTRIRSDRHVVIVVWDGMRPDFVTAENTPTLWKLAHEGVIFRNHHAVYLSATHVNGTAIETGMYPEHSGLIANYDYRPDIEPRRFVSTEQERVIRKGDEISGGKYLKVPTLAEMVRRAGGHSAVVSSKTVGFLLDRQPDARAAEKGVTISSGESLPESALAPIDEAEGFFPGFPMYAHAHRDSWTAQALTQTLWHESMPAFSMLWLGEPDLTQHETAPGAPAALAAIKSSDDNLAVVLSALEKKGVRGDTDVFVVSDHGFSTIEHPTDVWKYLVDGGLPAFVDFDRPPKPGDIMLVGNGGSVLFYVTGHEKVMTKKLVERLQHSNFAGVILTKQEMPGTFPLAKAQIDTPAGPDVVMAFRWTVEKNQFGVPGMINADWNRQAGKGTHATLGQYDMHNILFAAGPDFQRGAVDDLPTGNIDLAPTILDILRIAPAQKMDGRILTEMMSNRSEEKPKATTETIQAAQDFPTGFWQQFLKQSRVGSTIYLDEGNGAFVAKLEK